MIAKDAANNRRANWRRFLVFASICCLTIACLWQTQVSVAAQDTASLRPAVPKLDTTAPEKPEAEQPKKSSAPLKGGVQRSDSLFHKNPFLRGQGRARLDRGGQLKGNAENQGLNAEAESGVGIIGVKFVMIFGRQPVINRVFPQTPAFKAGIQPNDVIVAVDGIPTVGLAKEEVYDMIVGSPGTPVTISIQREGSYQSMTMTRMDLNDITDPFVRRDYLTNM